MIQKSIFFSLLLIGFLTSCGNDPLEIDASNTTIEMGYWNMDSILYHTDQPSFLQSDKDLKLAANELYEYQIGYCLNFSSMTDTVIFNQLQLYRKDTGIVQLEQRIEEKFPDPRVQFAKIKEGFRYLKAHLPNGKFPENIVFMNTLFRSSAFASEKDLGVGLERYLGPETDVVKRLPPDPFFQWMKDGMLPIYLERDAVAAWVMTHMIPEVEGNLSDKMIEWGKVLYLTEAAFPEAEKELILRYSKDEYEWALTNEIDFWKYLVNENLVFTTDERTQANMLNDGPFTAGLPEKGPDRLGQFLGWRIVHKFMDGSEHTLEDLLNTPNKTILQAYND